MTTTQVTGIFPDRGLAALAVEHLRMAGFTPDQVHVTDGRDADRHKFIHVRTTNTRRGIVVGAVLGTVLGTISGLLLNHLFYVLPAAIVGALAGALGGSLLGLLVGRTTTTQMEEEIESQVDAGKVLVSVDTDSAHGQQALDVLARDGAVNMVTTAATFRAGVLPTRVDGLPQQEIRDTADGNAPAPR